MAWSYSNAPSRDPPSSSHRTIWKLKIKSANLQCMNKCLLYDYFHFCHQPTALCSSDAKSCYDQITLLAVVLCLCHLRAPANAVLIMLSTIQNMNHHIRTAFGGPTCTANRMRWASPNAGIDQGNGVGLPI